MKADFVASLFRRVGLLCALALYCVALTACPPAWPKCRCDDDCKADKDGNSAKAQYYCVNSKCEQCRTGKDCSARQKCDGYRCVEKTCADIVCVGGKRCNPNTLSCEYICNADGENPCDGDKCKVCKSHQCVPKQPACQDSNGCPGNQVCKNGGTCDAVCTTGCDTVKCKPPNSCVNDVCTPPSCDMRNIYFDFNRALIRSDARSALKENAECAGKQKNKKVLIEGHCDERGTAEYNIQLGKRRARAAKKYLSNLGVDSSRICTVSKGKEEPVVSNATTGADHQKNRRGVFKFVDSCP